MIKEDIQPATMTVAEAARVLGIGRQTAYDLVRRGELPALRLGKRRLVVPKVALERLLATAGKDQTRTHGEENGHWVAPFAGKEVSDE